jgi:hypothetical protein
LSIQHVPVVVNNGPRLHLLVRCQPRRNFAATLTRQNRRAANDR